MMLPRFAQVVGERVQVVLGKQSQDKQERSLALDQLNM